MADLEELIGAIDSAAGSILQKMDDLIGLQKKESDAAVQGERSGGVGKNSPKGGGGNAFGALGSGAAQAAADFTDPNKSGTQTAIGGGKFATQVMLQAFTGLDSKTAGAVVQAGANVTGLTEFERVERGAFEDTKAAVRRHYAAGGDLSQAQIKTLADGFREKHRDLQRADRDVSNEFSALKSFESKRSKAQDAERNRLLKSIDAKMSRRK